jgi:hypothetical protein
MECSPKIFPGNVASIYLNFGNSEKTNFYSFLYRLRCWHPENYRMAPDQDRMRWTAYTLGLHTIAHVHPPILLVSAILAKAKDTPVTSRLAMTDCLSYMSQRIRQMLGVGDSCGRTNSKTLKVAL